MLSSLVFWAFISLCGTCASVVHVILHDVEVGEETGDFHTCSTFNKVPVVSTKLLRCAVRSVFFGSQANSCAFGYPHHCLVMLWVEGGQEKLWQPVRLRVLEK